MARMSPLMARRMSPLLMLGLTLFMFASEFALLLVTYLVLAPVAPHVLGEAAAGPARFAAWIALVKLPMTLAHMAAVSWRGWLALETTGEVPDPPVQNGWRRALVRMRDWGADAAWSVVAALIVFDHLADPGDAHVWQLVAVTAVGPFLLPKSVQGLFRLLRWWWRRRRTTHAPARPGEERIDV